MGATAALRRAFEAALELARRTGTPCYVMKGNKIVDIAKSPPRKKQSTSRAKRRKAT